MQHEITHRIHTEDLCQLIRVEHIALGLGHLPVAHQQPGMSEYLLRKRLAQRHQEDRPVDRMEANDILADQMKIRRPVFPVFILRSVGVIPGEGDVVAERVQPDIDHVLRVEVHRDPPGK